MGVWPIENVIKFDCATLHVHASEKVEKLDFLIFSIISTGYTSHLSGRCCDTGKSPLYTNNLFINRCYVLQSHRRFILVADYTVSHEEVDYGVVVLY